MAKKIKKEEWFKRGKEECECNHDKCKPKNYGCGGGGCVYGLGVVGATIYYISTASGFWMGVLGLLKALVWPAMLVYGLLKQLGM